MKTNQALPGKTRAACYMILQKANTICLIRRGNTGYKDGEWGLPAGKIDRDETFRQAAVRELAEEVGAITKESNLHHAITLHRKSDNEPGVTWTDVFFVCTKWEGEPYNAEPEKHDELQWFDVDNLPEDCIDYISIVLQAWKDGIKYLEFGWEKS